MILPNSSADWGSLATHLHISDGELSDGELTEEYAEKVYSEPAQILRIGEDRTGALAPWLDEMAALSIDSQYRERFARMEALWFATADVIGPFIHVSPVRLSRSQHAHVRPTLPRDRRV